MSIAAAISDVKSGFWGRENRKIFISNRVQFGTKRESRRRHIPEKAGIQKAAIKPATRNQARISAGGSPLPLWEKARMRAPTRASAALRAGRPRSQVPPANPSFPRKREF